MDAGCLRLNCQGPVELINCSCILAFGECDLTQPNRCRCGRIVQGDDLLEKRLSQLRTAQAQVYVAQTKESGLIARTQSQGILKVRKSGLELPFVLLERTEIILPFELLRGQPLRVQKATQRCVFQIVSLKQPAQFPVSLTLIGEGNVWFAQDRRQIGLSRSKLLPNQRFHIVEIWKRDRFDPG